MRLILKAKKLELTSTDKKSIPKKFLKFEKWIPEMTIVEVMISGERGVKGGKSKKATLNVDLPHYKIIHLEETADSITGAIDGLQKRLEVKLRRFRDTRLGQRRQDKLIRSLKEAIVYFPKKITGKKTKLSGPRIVKRKCFNIKPMNEREAIEEMKLLGHDFFVFKSARSQKFAVVYRRKKDKNFGLIECD